MAVEIQKEGNLAIITLNRPEARNAINGEMAMTMEACLDEFENDEKLFVLFSNGRYGFFFSIGFNFNFHFDWF